ncbi:uncharacterized protein LOC114271287 [Camellia sinensis]|uniref:uncharacterized protein LOC114271287 n=1 Tax=Camellia sinensis TaxID=4442 RepID=UPI0010366FCB|nr:uncharacterized protein LOC114271287 [Camellia sinensis]
MINTSWARPLHLLLFPEFGSSSPMETHPLRHRRCFAFPLQPFETHWLGKDLQFWLKIALGILHGALPDATLEEIEAYDDECAICREPMAKAKRLSCKHLFHLTCLRSWYDLCYVL